MVGHNETHYLHAMTEKYNRKKTGIKDAAQLVKCLSRMHEALDLIPTWHKLAVVVHA